MTLDDLKPLLEESSRLARSSNTEHETALGIYAVYCCWYEITKMMSRATGTNGVAEVTVEQVDKVFLNLIQMMRDTREDWEKERDGIKPTIVEIGSIQLKPGENVAEAIARLLQGRLPKKD